VARPEENGCHSSGKDFATAAAATQKKEVKKNKRKQSQARQTSEKSQKSVLSFWPSRFCLPFHLLDFLLLVVVVVVVAANLNICAG